MVSAQLRSKYQVRKHIEYSSTPGYIVVVYFMRLTWITNDKLESFPITIVVQHVCICAGIVGRTYLHYANKWDGKFLLIVRIQAVPYTDVARLWCLGTSTTWLISWLQLLLEGRFAVRVESARLTWLQRLKLKSYAKQEQNEKSDSEKKLVRSVLSKLSAKRLTKVEARLGNIERALTQISSTNALTWQKIAQDISNAIVESLKSGPDVGLGTVLKMKGRKLRWNISDTFFFLKIFFSKIWYWWVKFC